MTSSKVFIPDVENVWLLAEKTGIEDAKNNLVEVYITDPLCGERSDEITIVNLNGLPHGLTSLPLQNEDLPDTGVTDMCCLNYLHEASILDNLRRRFEKKLPYTYTNEMCIAVNPYEWLDIYSDTVRDQYSRFPRDELPPHVYATSAATFRGLRDTKVNQSVIVSGESGAGKTETVKLLMNHIANISSHTNDYTIEKVLRANPLLESFGNAKTCRNDNSSRFGKFIQLQFNEEAQLVGSKCITYLLEKSRVVSQSSVERNYHIFYQLFSAAPETRAKLHLEGKTIADFSYTNQGDVLTSEIEGKSDAERFAMTVNALTHDFSLSPQMLHSMLSILSGLLHLGEVKYVSSGLKSVIAAGEEGNADGASIEDTGVGAICCELLGLDPQTFASQMTSRMIEVEGRRLAVPLTLEQAVMARDALAKEIYSRVFNWLVIVINYNTMVSSATAASSNAAAKEEIVQMGDDVDVLFAPSSSDNAPAASSSNKCDKNIEKNKLVVRHTISLLDIFGFESFEVNRFEQFCINLANEKLQQLFTQDMIKSVQQEYEAEGLVTDASKHMLVSDNLHIIELIEGKKGVIAALNEECLVPKGSDASFLSKIKILFRSHSHFGEISNNSAAARNAPSATSAHVSFVITHYAGKVAYNVTGFLDRNKDTILANITEYMSSSSDALLSCLFSNSMIYSSSSSGPENNSANRHVTGSVAEIKSRPVSPMPGPSGYVAPVTGNIVNNRTVSPLPYSRSASNALSRISSSSNVTEVDAAIGSIVTRSPASSLSRSKSPMPTSPNRDPNSQTFSLISRMNSKISGSALSVETSELEIGCAAVGQVASSSSDSVTAEDIEGSNRSYLFTNTSLASILAATESGDGSSTSMRRVAPARRSSFLMAETITSKFKAQLNSLISDIIATKVHYIRCLKPNSAKSNQRFDRQMIVAQLRSAGMIEAVRIARSSYPVRLPHAEFLTKYRCLVADVRSDSCTNSADVCTLLLSHLFTTEEYKAMLSNSKYELRPYEVGLTRIYFTSPVLDLLNRKKLDFSAACIVRIQAVARAFICTARYQNMKYCAVVVQKYVRRELALQNYYRLLGSVVCIQCYMRRKLGYMRVHTLRVHYNASKIQAMFRSRRQLRLFMHTLVKVVVIQSAIRRRVQQRRYIKLRDQRRYEKDILLQLSTLKLQAAEDKAVREELSAMLEEVRLSTQHTKDEQSAVIEALRAELAAERASRQRVEDERDAAVETSRLLTSELTAATAKILQLQSEISANVTHPAESVVEKPEVAEVLISAPAVEQPVDIEHALMAGFEKERSEWAERVAHLQRQLEEKPKVVEVEVFKTVPVEPPEAPLHCAVCAAAASTSSAAVATVLAAESRISSVAQVGGCTNTESTAESGVAAGDKCVSSESRVETAPNTADEADLKLNVKLEPIVSGAPTDGEKGMTEKSPATQQQQQQQQQQSMQTPSWWDEKEGQGPHSIESFGLLLAILLCYVLFGWE